MAAMSAGSGEAPATPDRQPADDICEETPLLGSNDSSAGLSSFSKKGGEKGFFSAFGVDALGPVASVLLSLPVALAH